KRKESILSAADRTDESLLPALHKQLDAAPTGPFSRPLRSAIARIEIIKGTPTQQLAAAKTLKELTSDAALGSLQNAAALPAVKADKTLAGAVQEAIAANESYQTRLGLIRNTFYGISTGSILVLLALGLSIIFGLMGVINMAQGEFMMVGAFTTYVVSEFFKNHLPGAFDYYPLIAIPAAFLVAGFIGWLCEMLVIRHLYGRPLETLLATWGIGLILIQLARVLFGDNLSVKPPHWMEGGVEVMPDLIFPLNRLYIVAFCIVCIILVYFVVNRTRLGLLLRATTQIREMAAAAGVPTRRVDAMTFAFGAGLAGLAGVVVPLYNKINPTIGQEYIVNCFLVVVVGGVGALAGAIWAGFGLGFLAKYFEAGLTYIPAMASSSSVVGQVLVLALVVVFLQWRPAGLFPPRGRMADV
ncbi:MAG: urea ABC transporter permease subunit UrtB, partial [Tepidisphaeraceae bacterium]